ncbi:unnamed protein product [Mycena citricolor]|uniref:Uncharacterized protein n=1 Tax=Mycena citricolor TaxID=2018698 RepID=A0AAD2HG87_9AGAR|nr:unnamed protein product [Mycena citricolor]
MVGSVNTDKRLLWHPLQRNKFILGGGSQITLYEWAAEEQEIRHITSQHDLQFMKTFAWSPDPFFDDLVAVGLSTGRIDLLRLEATRTRRLAGGTSVLSGGPIISLTARNSRSCNALDFCRLDPNYLAVGLDKMRNDASLVIYDISSTRSKLSFSISTPNDVLVDSPKRPQPLIPRNELPPRADARTVQHHALTEVVTAVSYVANTNHLVLAGVSSRWLRLLDVRTAAPAITSVAAKVQSIVTDPSDPHRVATFGEGFVSVWDTRKIAPLPMLSFTEQDATGDGAFVRPAAPYVGIEFSRTRRGTLAALHKDTNYVRFWDLLGTKGTVDVGSATGSSDGGMPAEGSSLSSRLARKSWTAGLPWATSASTREVGHSSLVLSDTRRTKLFPKTLSSFALVPQPTTSLTSEVMVVSPQGDLEICALHDTPKQAVWSNRGDLAVSAGHRYRVFPGILDGEELEKEFIQQRERESSLEQFRYAQQQQDAIKSRSEPKSTSPQQHMLRGRRSMPSFDPRPVLFGRGDDDGFPALSTDSSSTLMSSSIAALRDASPASAVRVSAPTGISATRPVSVSKSRTFSPSSMRHYPYEPTQRSRSNSRPAILKSASTKDSAPPVKSLEVKIRAAPVSRSASRIRGIEHLIEDDISMVMRRRCLRGYSVGNPYHNTTVTRDDVAPVPEMLSGLWTWLNKAQDFLCVPTPRLHGYDFSYQGIMGIWFGFPHVAPPTEQTLERAKTRSRSPSRDGRSPADDLHGNFQAALSDLALRNGDKIPWKFHAVNSAKTLQRQIGLKLLGWSLREEDLQAHVKRWRWEQDGQRTRAACWLVFANKHAQALDVLLGSNDETDNMMSGTLAALTADPSSARNVAFREHCEKLIIRIQDPYLRAMLTHLTLGDWSEVLDEEAIPFRERLAIALQFLEDDALSSYLLNCVDNSCRGGHVDGLMVTGLTKRGLDILQSYVDRSGDFQTAAILASYVCPAKFTHTRAERWVEAYRDMLDGYKLHHYRVSFDIERGGLVQDAVEHGDRAPVDWAPRQILIRCNYCNKPVTGPDSGKHRPTTCANCNRSLPQCSVCLMTLSIVPDAVRDAEMFYSTVKDTIDDAILICQTCKHGGHASHIMDWFFGEDGRSHGLCAVANCDCRCADEF